MRDLRKVATFAISGALGCLVGALLGELWLPLTRSTTPERISPPRGIALVLDCSGSMDGPPLAEMKAAALGFVSGRDLSREKIMVVGFGDLARVACPLSDDQEQIADAIRNVEDGGGTDMGAGLDAARQALEREDSRRSLVLFTDGEANIPDEALRAAQDCRAADIELVAVATDEADFGFLRQATGDSALVIRAQVGQLSAAFQEVSKIISQSQLVESGGGGASFLGQVGRMAAWTALLASALATALIAGQNRYFRRPLWNARQMLVATLGGGAGGLVAGGIVQMLFGAVSGAPAPILEIGRLLGWVALGALVGGAVTLFVPNLSIQRGAAGGAAGGLAGGVLFFLAALVLGDFLGRILGAVALGLLIGAMIAIAEVAARRLWLEVLYGPKEKRIITLGSQPITVGSDREQCQILVSGAPRIALRYRYENRRLMLEDVPAGRTVEVYAGDTRPIGNLKLVVREATNRDTRQQSSAATADRPAAPTAMPPPEPLAAAQQSLALSMPRPTGFFLRANGRFVPLIDNSRFTAEQLGVRDVAPPSNVCAEVVRNPADPNVFGLKNLTSTTWQATLASGESRTAEPGKSVKLARGTKITMGLSTIHIE